MKTFRQVFTLRNIVPLLAIALAFLGTTGFLQTLGFTTDQIILALLGILGVDSVVERLGYLNRIENTVNSLSLGASKPLFLNRTALNAEEAFEQFVARGREVLIGGVTLVGTVGPLRTFFKTTMQQGTRLRFLLLDPDSPHLESAARTHGVSPESLRNDILSSLGHLRQLMDSLGNSKGVTLQVRLLRVTPDAGIAMRDGNRDNGEIRCELYLFQTDVAGRPAFRLKPSDGVIYNRYRDAIERLWNDSVPWKPE